MEDEADNEKLVRLARGPPPGYEGRPLHPRGCRRGFSAVLLGLVDNQPTRLTPLQLVFDNLPLLSVFIEWLQLMSIVGNVVLTLPDGWKALLTVASIADTAAWLSNTSLDDGLYYTGLGLCLAALVLMSGVLYCFWSGRDAAPPGVVFALRIVTRLQTTVLFLPVVRVMLGELRCVTHPSIILASVDISSSATLPQCVAWRVVLAVLALLVQLPIGLFVAANSMQADPAARDLTRRHNTLFDLVNLVLRFLASVISVFVRPVSADALVGVMLGLGVVYSTLLQLIQPYYSAWMMRVRSGLFLSLTVWCITALIVLHHPHSNSSLTMLIPVLPAIGLGMLLFRTRWRSYIVDAALTAVARPLTLESSAFFIHDYFLESLLHSPQRCGQYATFLSRFDDDHAASRYFAEACQYGVQGSHELERSRWEERMTVMAQSLAPALHLAEHVIRQATSPHVAVAQISPNLPSPNASGSQLVAPAPPAMAGICHLIDVEVGEGAAPKDIEYALQSRLTELEVPFLHTNSVSLGAISVQRLLWSLIGGERASHLASTASKLRQKLTSLDAYFPLDELSALCAAVERDDGSDEARQQPVEEEYATLIARALASVLAACGNKASAELTAIVLGNHALITPTLHAVVKALPPLLRSPVMIIAFRAGADTSRDAVAAMLGGEQACRIYGLKIAHDQAKPKYRTDCLKVEVSYPAGEMACVYCGTMPDDGAQPPAVHAEISCQELLVARAKVKLAYVDLSGGAFRLLEFAAALGPRSKETLFKVWRALDGEGSPTPRDDFNTQLTRLVRTGVAKLRKDGTVAFTSHIFRAAVIATLQASDKPRWRLINWVCGVTLPEDPSTKFWRRRHFMEAWCVERFLHLAIDESIHFLLPGFLAFQSCMLALFLSHHLALRDGFGSRTSKDDPSENVHTEAETYLTTGVNDFVRDSGAPALSEAFDETALPAHLRALVQTRPLDKVRSTRHEIIQLLGFYVIFELRVGYNKNAAVYAKEGTIAAKRLARTPIEHAEALASSCMLFAFMGELTVASEDAKAIVPLLSQLPNDFDGEGTSLRAMRALAATARREKDLPAAVHYYTTVVRIGRASGVKHIDDVARGLSGLGMCYRDRKWYKRGAQLMTQGLELFVWLGQGEFYGDSMHGLGLLYTMENIFDKARNTFATVLDQGLNVVGLHHPTQCMVGILDVALLSGNWGLYDWCRAKLKINKNRYPVDPRVMLLARARVAITTALVRSQYSQRARDALASRRLVGAHQPSHEEQALSYPSPLDAILTDAAVRQAVAALADVLPAAIKDMDKGRSMIACVRESAIARQTYFDVAAGADASVHETGTAAVILHGLLRDPSIIAAANGAPVASGAKPPLSPTTARLRPVRAPLPALQIPGGVAASSSSPSGAPRPLASLPPLASSPSRESLNSSGGGEAGEADRDAPAFVQGINHCRRMMMGILPAHDAPMDAVSGAHVVDWLVANSTGVNNLVARIGAVARAEGLRAQGLIASVAGDEQPFRDDADVAYRVVWSARSVGLQYGRETNHFHCPHSSH